VRPQWRKVTLCQAHVQLWRTLWRQEKIASRGGFRSVDAMRRAFAQKRDFRPQGFRDSERHRASM